MDDPRALKLEIESRVADLIASDPVGAAVAMIDAALAALAKQFPAKLSDSDKTLVRENYPPATDALIAERAMSEQGVVTAIAAGVQLAKIALDYSPLSHTKTEMDQDFALPREAVAPVTRACADVFKQGDAAGMSTYGVATTMILMAAVMASEKGVTGFKLVRPLLDATSKVLAPNQISEADADELAIATLRERMGVSREVAKRYVKQAKERPCQE